MSVPAKSVEPRTAKPGEILSQWWTMGTLVCDRRTKGRHLKVAWVVIERFMQKKGGGRASVRFIQQATGLAPRIIMQASTELSEWGYFSRFMGSGTRPTEYVPNWTSVHPMWNAKSSEI